MTYFMRNLPTSAMHLTLLLPTSARPPAPPLRWNCSPPPTCLPKRRYVVTSLDGKPVDAGAHAALQPELALDQIGIRIWC
jgi:hypothetical protein